MTGSEILHLEFPRMKHEENSPQGDWEAIAEGDTASDHDQQKGLSRKSFNTHWKNVFERDHFYDPLHQYGPHTPHGEVPFDQLPDEVIERLVAHSIRHGHVETFHIRTTEAGIRHAAHVGLKRVYCEAKPGNDWTVADFRAWKATAKDAGIGLTIMAMDSWPGWRKVRTRALLAGVRFRRLHMHGRRG